MRLYGTIEKVDAEKRIISGYASTEAKDSAGEIVLKSAVEAALDDYLEFSNIREMHQLSAVGVAVEAATDEKGLYIAAQITDDAAWAKVVSKTYKGFSIGGRVLERDAKNKKIITKIALNEISLVDRPSNPEARFDVWKAAGIETEDTDLMAEAENTKTEGEKAVDAQVALRVAAEAAMTKAADAAGLAKAAAEEAEAALAKATADLAALPVVDPVAKAAEVEVVDATEKPEGVAEDVEAVVDPVAKAADLVEALAEKLASPVEDELVKSIYSVSRLGDVLSTLSYIIRDKESDKDGSKIPAKMRKPLAELAGHFKEMAAEEADKFVSDGAAKAAEAEAIAKAAGEAAGANPDPAATDALAKAEALSGDLRKSLAANGEAITKIAERLEPLLKAVDDLKAENGDLKKRLETVEDSPAAAKTAGSFAVAKGLDTAGAAAALEKATSDDVAAALGSLSEDDRALVITKAALMQPKRINYR